MEALTDLHLDDVTRKEVPAMYGNVEIKYSKFGVDDFDFAYVSPIFLFCLNLTVP
jgi:PAB-dependent poly(A)-specific ribonuclease subunit 2